MKLLSPNNLALFTGQTNHQITTIEVNGQKGNLVRESDFALWYYIWEDPPLSLSIQAKDQAGKVLSDEKLF